MCYLQEDSPYLPGGKIPSIVILQILIFIHLFYQLLYKGRNYLLNVFTSFISLVEREIIFIQL